ncbi:MAG: GumC family protein [Thermovirgaceae bacterium]
MDERSRKENDRCGANPESPDGYRGATGYEEELSLLDLLSVLASHKFLIFWITLLFAVGSIVASLVMTPQFRAAARIMNPVQRPSVLGILPQGAQELARFAMPEIEGNLYVGMLESRSMRDYVLDLFAPENWRELTGPGLDMSMEDLVSEYIGEMTAEATKNGMIEVSVVYTDPVLAAEIANAYVDGLKAMTKRLSVTEASQRRFYYEQELERARVALSRSEADLREFQEKTGVYMGQAQLSANIQSRINLRARIAGKEIQLKSLMAYATSQNPEVVKLQKEIDALKGELKQLEEMSSTQDPLNPEGGMPAATFEYLQRYREWKFHEAVYETLLKLYETARLEEAINPVVIQVVDEAQPPEQRFKPKRKLMVVLASMLGFFIALFAAFLAEFARRASRDPEEKKKLDMVREAANPMTYIRHIFRIRRKPGA